MSFRSAHARLGADPRAGTDRAILINPVVAEFDVRAVVGVDPTAVVSNSATKTVAAGH
jgi:hypothetical protein